MAATHLLHMRHQQFYQDHGINAQGLDRQTVLDLSGHQIQDIS
eukprot:COSAG05_NODE_17219_length_329_cov_1.104348_1_plen_42_part_01